jgi:Activator of Hsp90 ATPase homolog 1-like protein
LIEPLQISFEVNCSVEHAFDTWTNRIETWWPKEHTVSGERDAAVILEARPGGRLYERTALGTEHEWGEVTVWEPPRRFGYLWHIRRDRTDATDVEISFTGLDAVKTRVDILHTGWERLGADGQRWRDRNVSGWDGVIPDYVQEAQRR